MSDLLKLFAGKKIQPRYMYLDWQFELGVVVEYNTWIPHCDIIQYFGSDLNLFTSLVDVQIKFDQSVIQQQNIDSIHEFSGAHQIDETDLYTQHVLEISVTGLNNLSSANWHGNNVAAAVNVKQLNIQHLSVKEVFINNVILPDREHGTTIIGNDLTQQLVIELPVYHWLLKNSKWVLRSMQ
jgi:hypothetical protein